MIPLMALAASAWLALIILTPLLPVPLAGLAYLAGSLICHQLPERSFHIGAAQLPVCARCLGIYVGAAAMTLNALNPLWGGPCRVRLASLTPGSPSRVRDGVAWLAPLTLMAAGAMPTAVTVALEWLEIWEPSNLARALSGVPLGAVVAFVVVDAVAKLHYEPCAPQRPIAPRPPPTPI